MFKSRDRLNISQVSRSLRVFSMYLIDERHELNFSDLVSGKRLFRMTATEIAVEDNYKERKSDEAQVVSLDDFEKLDIDGKLNAIYALLMGRRTDI